MKKLFLSMATVVAIFSMVTISSCGKNEVTVPFNIDEQTFCIAQNPFNTYATFDFNITKTTIQAAFAAANQTYDVSKLKEAKLSGLKVVTESSAITFDEFQGVEVYLREVGATADGEQVAYSQSIGSGVNEVTLAMNGKELKDWVAKDQFQVHVKVLNKGSNAATCVKMRGGVIGILIGL